MSIEQLASRVGVPIDAIRHWREGVLPAPARGANRCRRYVPDDARRLRFVRRTKGPGFALAGESA